MIDCCALFVGLKSLAALSKTRKPATTESRAQCTPLPDCQLALQRSNTGPWSNITTQNNTLSNRTPRDRLGTRSTQRDVDDVAPGRRVRVWGNALGRLKVTSLLF